jgi:hypothetical protein
MANSSKRVASIAKYALKHDVFKAAEQYGISYTSVERYVRAYKNRHRRPAANANIEVQEKETPTKFTERDDAASLEGQAYSLDELLIKADVDLDMWEVETYEIKDNSYDVTMKNVTKDIEYKKNKKKGRHVEIPGGTTVTNRQFYIKARLKRKTDFTSRQKFRLEMIKELKEFSPKVKKINRVVQKTGNMLEINMPDLHLGKLSWAEETGFKDYDLKIAVDRYWKAFYYLVGKACAATEFEQVLLVVGNDLFNSDNHYPYSATTKGTPQQDDSRWQKIFRIGRQMMIQSILVLKEIAPVLVKVIPGNHDFQKSFYLGDVLEVKFEGDEDVIVDNSPKTRKYVEWGDCLIGFTHGGHGGETEIRMVNNMHHEAARGKDFLYKEWHCGDIHHYKEMRAKGRTASGKLLDKYAEDIDGVVIRYLRTLFFNDEWEAKKGYISQKGAHCFVWNKREGNVAEYKYNLNE